MAQLVDEEDRHEQGECTDRARLSGLLALFDVADAGPDEEQERDDEDDQAADPTGLLVLQAFHFSEDFGVGETFGGGLAVGGVDGGSVLAVGLGHRGEELAAEVAGAELGAGAFGKVDHFRPAGGGAAGAGGVAASDFARVGGPETGGGGAGG